MMGWEVEGGAVELPNVAALNFASWFGVGHIGRTKDKRGSVGH